MDKKQLTKALLAQVTAELEIAQRALKVSKDSATSSEAKQESKYDTRGLEESYLAQGQADQVAALESQVGILKSFASREFGSSSFAGLGSILKLRLAEEESLFFFAPAGGGRELQEQGEVLTVLTPDSPLGETLLARAARDKFQMPNGRKGEVISVE